MSCNKRDKHTKMNNLHQFCFYFKILFKSENWVQSIDLIKRDHRHFSHSITGTAEPVNVSLWTKMLEILYLVMIGRARNIGDD